MTRITAFVVAILAATIFSGAAASAPARKQAAAPATITVATLNIANALPMDLGIRKGFFEAEGITITKRVLQSGNDVVLALANGNGEIGYLGYVPMMIARTQGIPFTAVAASEVEGTNELNNWQNILVRGNSSIRTPADLSGKTVAVNALKGVGEVMIKAALQKRGVNPESVRLVAMGFGVMRAALNNGQVDAVWTPEPFLSQIIGDGGRTVLAPGPVLGNFWPIGGYGALNSWIQRNPALAARFRRAINRSLTYAQANPNEIRDLLPAASRNVRLPIWSPLVDRAKLAQLAGYARRYEVIPTLPNLVAMVPSIVTGGKNLQGTVGNRFIALRLDGIGVKTLTPGRYTFIVSDTSRTRNFRLTGPGVNRTTSVRGLGRATWTVTLRRGVYTFRSSAGQAAAQPDVPSSLSLSCRRAPRGALQPHGSNVIVGAMRTSSSSGSSRSTQRRDGVVELPQQLVVRLDPPRFAAEAARDLGDVDVERRPGCVEAAALGEAVHDRVPTVREDHVEHAGLVLRRAPERLDPVERRAVSDDRDDRPVRQRQA